MHELGSLLTTSEMAWTDNKVSSGALADIIDQLIHGKVTGNTAKQVLKMVFDGDKRTVGLIIKEDGLALRPLSSHEYEMLAKHVIEANPEVVQQICNKGRTGKLMFLVGQMMRQGEEGRVEAQKAEKTLRQLLIEKQS